MEFATRSYLTAAVAVTLAGAGVAVVHDSPLPGLPDVQARPVQLAASDDIPWEQVLQTASANATDIYDHLSPAAFADVQQFLANVPDYLDDTRNFSADLTTAFNAATTPFIPVDPEPYIYSSLDTTPSTISIDSFLGSLELPLQGKDGLLDILANGLTINLGITTVNIDVLSDLAGSTDAAQIEPFLPFSGSPLSGILWGSFGTVVGPLLQFNDDIAAITDALNGSDYTTAFNDLADMPANLTNAFLNGYGDIELDTLLGDLGITPPDIDASIDLDLGGLLSPAGSLINGIGLTDTLGVCSIACATFDVPSSMVGPIASLFEQDQAIAESIGWDGVGQPLAHLFSELTTLF